jgi:hypothetical protein
MEENIINPEILSDKPKRPQLLTVLCVLSFVMCALMVLAGFWGIYQSQPEVMQKNVEQVRAFNPEMADQMENQILAMADNPYHKISNYLGLVYTLLSFLGVMMMWNLKKKGFYLYAIAEILPYTGFVFMGKNSLNMMGGGAGSATIGMIFIVLMVIIDVVFVYLYSRNLKEMD